MISEIFVASNSPWDNPACPRSQSLLPTQLSFDIPSPAIEDHELQIIDGVIPLPEKPGLGIEVNMDALRAFEVDP
jgi:hypothetical protein